MSRRPKSRIVAAFAVAILVIVGYGTGLLLYHHFVPADILSIATVQTERVSFEANDGRKAAFYVGGMLLSTEGNPPRKPCVTGLVTPVNGAMVTYGRVGNGTTEIDVVAPQSAQPSSIAAKLDQGEGIAPQQLASPVVIAADEQCMPSVAPRLPIWGRVSIGQEFQPQTSPAQPDPSFLISGNVLVWAKAVFDSSSHYAVADLPIPVGSRLEAEMDGSRSAGTSWWKIVWRKIAYLLGLGMNGDARSAGAVWWGIAYADPVKPGLTVNVATEARKLALFRPYEPKADVIEVSWVTQLTKDPFLEELHFLVFALAGLIGFLVSRVGRPLDPYLDRARKRDAASTLGPITSKIGRRRDQGND